MRAMNSMSRADLVRERQKQNLQEKTKRTTQTIQQPIKSASIPITKRKEAFAVSYPAYPKQTNRRQYNYSIGATGAEIRLPAISTINIGWKFLSFFLGVFCMVGIFLLFNSAEFEVQQIQTSGFQRLTANDLNAVIDTTGESLIWFDVNQAKQDLLLAFPEIKELEISISFPNEVRIQAIERQPVLLWQTEKQAYWLDAEGVLIPPRGEVGELLTIHASAAPPIIQTTQTENLSNIGMKNADKTLTQVSAAQLMGWGEMVDPILIEAANQLMVFIPPDAKILYNHTHGLGWIAEQGWDVYVGLTLNDINYKLNAYQALVEKFSKEGKNPSMVSIEFTQRPYYRE
ncbi:MAG TPA: FtsQ-type POTRA domain-containing protein [Anaerolineaceae bacterium]|nr:FtsQ-type POTRA domain-containing protein [Anaerolineaceae bacterium]